MTIETAEILPHYSGMPKFYPSTAERRSFTSLLQDTEILPPHCETVKLYLSTTCTKVLLGLLITAGWQSST